MGKIIDLSTIIKDDLIFEGCPDGEKYVIPGSISTQLVLEIQKTQQDLKEKSEEENMDMLFDMLVVILNLDKTKSIDKDYAKKHFDDIRLLKILIEAFMEHINNISNDPN